MTDNARVRIQTTDFDVAQEIAALRAGDPRVGAVCSFVGTVRDRNSPGPAQAGSVVSLELEHYPGMTERSIEAMIDDAHRRFDIFGASVIHRVGLLHEVTSAEGLDAKVAELTQALVNASPNAVRACKKLVQDVAEREINDALVAQTVAGIADIRASSEGKEGVQSFLQKRKPNWLLA